MVPQEQLCRTKIILVLDFEVAVKAYSEAVIQLAKDTGLFKSDQFMPQWHAAAACALQECKRTRELWELHTDVHGCA